jgi:stress-induced morphogen
MGVGWRGATPEGRGNVAARRAFEPEHVLVHDDSAGCGQHLSIVVVAKAFDGVGILDRQKRVYAVEKVSEQLKRAHAVVLKTWTPAQFADRKSSLEPALLALLE